MKKILFSVMALSAITFTSCGKQAEGTAVEDSIVVEEVAVDEEQTPATEAAAATIEIEEALQSGDATKVQTVLTQVQTKIQELVEKGDTEAAKAYAETVGKYITTATEKLQSAGIDATPLQTALSAATGLASDTREAAEGVADAAVETAKTKATEAANAAVETAKSKTNEAVTSAQTKANEAVNAAQQKANQKVNEAQQKANDAVQKAASNALNKALGK